MRLGLTLNRIGNAWQVTHLPSVPLADQLADFKAKQVAGEFTADETLIVSLGDTLKRHAKKANATVVATEPEQQSPKPKKK
jgi:hypothetical protein